MFEMKAKTGRLKHVFWVRDSSEKPTAWAALCVARGLVADSPTLPQGWF